MQRANMFPNHIFSPDCDADTGIFFCKDQIYAMLWKYAACLNEWLVKKIQKDWNEHVDVAE